MDVLGRSVNRDVCNLNLTNIRFLLVVVGSVVVVAAVEAVLVVCETRGAVCGGWRIGTALQAPLTQVP